MPCASVIINGFAIVDNCLLIGPLAAGMGDFFLFLYVCALLVNAFSSALTLIQIGSILNHWYQLRAATQHFFLPPPKRQIPSSCGLNRVLSCWVALASYQQQEDAYRRCDANGWNDRYPRESKG